MESTISSPSGLLSPAFILLVKQMTRTSVPLSPSVGSLTFLTHSFTSHKYFLPMPSFNRCRDGPGTVQRLHPSLKLTHLFLLPPCHQSTPDMPTNRMNLQNCRSLPEEEEENSSGISEVPALSVIWECKHKVPSN